MDLSGERRRQYMAASGRGQGAAGGTGLFEHHPAWLGALKRVQWQDEGVQVRCSGGECGPT